jgi:hypothetical protein
LAFVFLYIEWLMLLGRIHEVMGASEVMYELASPAQELLAGCFCVV